MSLVVHGIPNCSTVKKARDWLEARGLAYTFHDFRKQGVPEVALDRWIAVHGWERLLNRAGTTWRQLDETRRATVTDAASARALMLEKPSVIKRPVVDWGEPPGTRCTVGFQPAQFEAAAST